MVAYAGVALLEVEAFLQLTGAIGPLNVEGLHRGREEVCDAIGANNHVNHVSIRAECVFDVKGTGGDGKTKEKGRAL